MCDLSSMRYTHTRAPDVAGVRKLRAQIRTIAIVAGMWACAALAILVHSCVHFKL